MGRLRTGPAVPENLPLIRSPATVAAGAIPVQREVSARSRFIPPVFSRGQAREPGRSGLGGAAGQAVDEDVDQELETFVGVGEGKLAGQGAHVGEAVGGK